MMKTVFPFHRAGRAVHLGLAACLALATTPSFAASPAWLTAHDAEVKAIVARMTLEEKACLLYTSPSPRD